MEAFHIVTGLYAELRNSDHTCEPPSTHDLQHEEVD